MRKIWVLYQRIDRSYDQIITAYESEESARQALYKDVIASWFQECGTHPMPKDRDAAIELFHELSDDTYLLEEVEVWP